MPASRLAERRTLPRTGQSVPVLGLGGAALGNLHRPMSSETALAMLGDAWSGGLRYFDTAPLYGRGLGELRTGSALRSRARTDYIVSSKVGWRVVPLDAAPAEPDTASPFRLVCDYSRDGTRRSIEDSLIRLGVASLDIAFVHDVDPYNHGDQWPRRLREVLDGALPALAELKANGVIRAFGVGVNNVEVCRQVLREADVDVLLLAGRYTLLDRSAGEALLPECVRRKVGVVIGAPFNSGLLASGAGPAPSRYNYKPAEQDVLARVRRMEERCRAAGVSLAAAALQFPLRDPAVVSVLPGPRTRAQLAGLLTAFEETIPEGLWPELATL